MDKKTLSAISRQIDIRQIGRYICKQIIDKRRYIVRQIYRQIMNTNSKNINADNGTIAY